MLASLPTLTFNTITSAIRSVIRSIMATNGLNFNELQAKPKTEMRRWTKGGFKGHILGHYNYNRWAAIAFRSQGPAQAVDILANFIEC